MPTNRQSLAGRWNHVRQLGASPGMGEYERRKLYVFNQLNAIGIGCGLLLPLIGFLDDQELPALATWVSFSPALIGSIVLALNARRRHEAARLVYFSLYPVITSLVYAAGLDVGVELFFVLYGILAIFYLQKLRNGIAAFALSMLCYFLAFVCFREPAYRLELAHFPFFVLNHVLATVFIFFSLIWLKRENNGYQQGLLETTREVRRQNEIIAGKAEQLSELNALKNKLFSVIAHDLKTPIYALRNLFRNVERFDIPGEEVKQMIPDIVKDLNYTNALMENLLQWAKAQMSTHTIHWELLDVRQLIDETIQLLRLQAESKQILLANEAEEPLRIYADKDMLQLVLRNLISNAIKFTPEKGQVRIEASDDLALVEVAVRDTGMGMTPEVLAKLSGNEFYTSRGTANESGTGLGLMLCKDFLQKIGGQLRIESEYGKGSRFAIQLSKDGRSR